MQKITLELESAVKQAMCAWESSPDTKKYEPFFINVLKLVKAELDAPLSEQFFLSLMDDSSNDYTDLIMFCMRELRHPLVKEKAKNLCKVSSDVREKNSYERILSVYEDCWEDQDLFEYFS